jgi:hypothetical protein
MFLEALVALVPSGSRIAIFIDFLWCAVWPLASRWICSQATRGLNLMLWILEHICAYHLAFACETEMAMWWLRRQRSACMVDWMDWGRCEDHLTAWRSWLWVVRRGARVARLSRNHPSHFRLLMVMVSFPAFRIAALYLP